MKKFDEYKKPLKHKRVTAQAFVNIENDPEAFQGYRVKKLADISFPFTLGKDEVIIDFGDHYTGYLHLSAQGTPDHIPDSPTLINFTFGEMPIEIAENVCSIKQSLSPAWLQNDSKSIAFMPYEGSLERRYSFRYLKLKREYSAYFDIQITDLYIDAVSAVDMDEAIPFSSGDEVLDKINYMCVKTLKECEQEVFEDGPKRDRRLWIGDLRLQALVDYNTFKNIDLIKRCIYLFAHNLNNEGLVAPCVFPDTPPFIDQWIYLDYSMCLVLCLSDYLENTGDRELPDELYEIAMNQLKYAEKAFDRKNAKIDAPFFIDHGNYNRCIAALGYFAYTINHAKKLAKELNKDAEWLDRVYDEVCKALMTYRDEDKGIFVTREGEISWQSQVWTILSGALTVEEAHELLSKTIAADPKIRMSSPFMTHYYLEALYFCGEADTAINYIKEYWGAIIDAGFDCCPECFDLRDEMISPYHCVVLNSACHAWSCTPSYWIRKYYINGNK